MSDLYGTEKDLARDVVAWLRSEDWEVWQEVHGVYDIVAKCGPVLWAIETKLTLNIKVLAQARRRRIDVHRVSVAVPPKAPKDYDSLEFLERIAADYGIGIIHAMPGQYGGIREHSAPAFIRHKHNGGCVRLREHLAKMPQDFVEAGGNRGGYWTRFKDTAGNVVRFVAEHPGASLKETIDAISHHYGCPSTARARIGKLAEKGVIKGVRVERDGKRIKLYPTNEVRA